MQAIQDLISIPKLKTKKKKRENRIKFSPNKSINKIVTPLFTFLPFLATKQSLLKKNRDKRKPYRVVVSLWNKPKSASIICITTTTSDGGFFSPSTKLSFVLSPPITADKPSSPPINRSNCGAFIVFASLGIYWMCLAFFQFGWENDFRFYDYLCAIEF